jgi:putative transcriptional regulator
VATPTLLDPNFFRTVLLVLEHSSEGAVGLVLNRPSETPVGAVLERWDGACAPPGVFYQGGPVAPTGMIGLAVASSGPVDGWVPLFDGYGTVDLGESPETVPKLDALRVFAGHAGWSPGQLDNEVEGNGWFVVERLPTDAFTIDPSTLWTRVLARQRGRLSWYVNCPPDPSVN